MENNTHLLPQNKGEVEYMYIYTYMLHCETAKIP